MHPYAIQCQYPTVTQFQTRTQEIVRILLLDQIEGRAGTKRVRWPKRFRLRHRRSERS